MTVATAFVVGGGVLLAALIAATWVWRPRRFAASLSRRDRAESQPAVATLRDIESRIEANFAVLDRMIEDADQEIARLESLLHAARNGLDRDAGRHADGIAVLPFAKGARPLSAEQREMIRILARTGYTAPEIAGTFRHALDQVEAALREEDGDCPASAA